MIHSFLMIGQSNMAGRGYIQDVPVICNERIKMLRNGLWQMMIEPIHYDRPFTGIGLGASFASMWCNKNEAEEIGLIPCAEGASSLDNWAVGGALFENAVFQAGLAQRASQLEGILWHQGENDCNPEGVKLYYEKFLAIIEALRERLKVPNIPVIVGGLGNYLTAGKYGNYFHDYPRINQVLLEFANTQDNCYFVTASDLKPNPDNIHFNALSQRIFGLRYYEAYEKRTSILEPMKEEISKVNELNNRPLSKAEIVALLGNEFGRGNISIEAYEEQLSKINNEE
jgi:hypothetical protein